MYPRLAYNADILDPTAPPLGHAVVAENVEAVRGREERGEARFWISLLARCSLPRFEPLLSPVQIGMVCKVEWCEREWRERGMVRSTRIVPNGLNTASHS
jgi:hypothetical protein